MLFSKRDDPHLNFLYDILAKLEEFVTNNLWFAPLLSVLLPFIEAIVPSLPLTVLIAFNINIMSSAYGTVQGTIWTIILSTLGSFLGMLLVFTIIRLTFAPYFFKKVEENKYGKMFLNLVEGPKVIPVLLVMSNPFLPSSVINYALSLTKTKVSRYLFLTIMSRLIIILFLVFLGSIFDIQNHPLNLLWLLLFYFVLFGSWYLWYHFRKNKISK